ncbi:MAG: NAD(P)/FAD-dependent oxidoreductase [Chloroflexota bacterium]|nr:MAG: hypothetical protein DLM70_10350 [Chloroflexota bacterium]
MPTVTILGGGYAGIRATRRVAEKLDKAWNIQLVDRGVEHQLITRLPEIVGGTLDPSRCLIPYMRLVAKRVQLIRAHVITISPSLRQVETSIGTLTADSMLVALGGTANCAGIEGAERHALPVRSVDNALEIHRRVQFCLVAQEEVRVVIIGGGYTATEVAGALIEWRRGLERARTGKTLAVTIVNDVDRLLPAGNQRLAEVAERVLSDKGVAVRHRAPVTQVETNEVRAGDVSFPADIVIWAARSRASPCVDDAHWQLGPEGRVVVDNYLRSSYEGVYVAGDAALAYDYARDVPTAASAQLAVQEGQIAGENMAADILGKPRVEFRPGVLGEALLLGGHSGVAELAGVVLTGRAALATKHGALIRYLARAGGPRLAADYG